MTWLRRNRWWLLVLLPVLVAAGWLHYDDVYEGFHDRKPTEPVAAGDGGWVSFAGARMRLVSLEKAEDLEKNGGDPFTVPGGATAWRATIAFEAPDQDAIGGCQVSLEDDRGRTYDSGPSELSGARTGFASCGAPDKATPASYQSVVYFVTPGGTRATAVRITLATKLPRYARLTTSG